MIIASTFARNIAGAAVALLLGTSCLVAAAGPAAAQSVDAVRTQTIGYSDLNLNSTAGRAALAARIRAAARNVCSSDLFGVERDAAEAQCIANAIKTASPVRPVTVS